MTTDDRPRSPEPSLSSSPGAVAVIGALAALVMTAVWLTGTFSAKNGLVVYCAHDAVYSEDILRKFEQDTGIPIEIRFDTEATKSLGLVQLIEREQTHPRCDVFWNNELLGTLALQEQGLLEPYQGSGWQRMPDRFRDPAGYWVGFAARLRVWIVNINAATATERTIQAILDTDTSRAAFAQPMFGTTLTHYTVLWHTWGEATLREWHASLRQRGLQEVRGNAVVKDLVVAGQCDCGATDTDDVFVAIDEFTAAEKPATVEMLPIRVDGQTIAIPNTVGIIKGTQHRTAAEKLVDYLTSAETELALARAKSRQIPLGPVDDVAVPSDVKRLREWAANSVDLRPLLTDRNACLAWLRKEYAP